MLKDFQKSKKGFQLFWSSPQKSYRRVEKYGPENLSFEANLCNSGYPAMDSLLVLQAQKTQVSSTCHSVLGGPESP